MPNIYNFDKFVSAKDKLIHWETNMLGKRGPLYNFLLRKMKRHNEILKLNKSKFDVISNEMLKCNPQAISRVLCGLFNFTHRNKTFPKSWNLPLLIPIHKTGIATKHENYRGICISNHLSTFFTLIINNRLEKMG